MVWAAALYALRANVTLDYPKIWGAAAYPRCPSTPHSCTEHTTAMVNG